MYHLQLIYLFKMVIFNSYVNLPEGTRYEDLFGWLKIEISMISRQVRRLLQQGAGSLAAQKLLEAARQVDGGMEKGLERWEKVVGYWKGGKRWER